MKNRIYIHAIVLAAVFIAGTAYGILFHKHNIFPYTLVKKAYHTVQGKKYGPWSIGIYTGATPFSLADPEAVSNPILTAGDITDIDAVFVADPFMITRDGTHFLFFEVLNRATDHGDIAYATSTDLKTWQYKNVILDEEFHVSFPFVFEWDAQYYLVPESHEDFSVRLYRATDFPEAWEYVGNLLSGYRYIDTTIFRHDGTWWLFTSTADDNILNLYFSDDLLHGWTPHPMNPIVKLDKRFARPAGRVFTYENSLYRLTQDCEDFYGKQVFAFEITELTRSTYAERLVSPTPLVGPSDTGWNAAGMHHIDLHRTAAGWVGLVDGQSR